MDQTSKDKYINELSGILGEMFDYAVRGCNEDGDRFFEMFCKSDLAEGLTKEPAWQLGSINGKKLAQALVKEVSSATHGSVNKLTESSDYEIDRTSIQYWAGRVLGLYFGHLNYSFKEIMLRKMNWSTILKMQALRRADVSILFSAFDSVVFTDNAPGALLKQRRMMLKLTQKELSEKSGVTLRMIQLYEQGRNDLTKAEAWTAAALSEALGCTVAELIGFRS